MIDEATEPVGATGPREGMRVDYQTVDDARRDASERRRLIAFYVGCVALACFGIALVAYMLHIWPQLD